MTRTPQERSRRLALVDDATSMDPDDGEGDTRTRDQLLSGSGWCSRCQRHAHELMLIRIIATNSGPGGSAYACVPCARAEVRRVTCPDWLRTDVARLDAWDAAQGKGDT